MEVKVVGSSVASAGGRKTKICVDLNSEKGAFSVDLSRWLEFGQAEGVGLTSQARRAKEA